MLRRVCLSLLLVACSEKMPNGEPSSVTVADANPTTPATESTPGHPAPAQPGPVAKCPTCPECVCTEADLQDLKRQLAAAEERIAVLSATPEAVYAELRPKLDAESFTMEALDQNLKAIDNFRARFPKSAESKLLIAEVKEIEAMKKRLEAKVREESEAKAAHEMVKLVGEVEDGTDFPLESVQRVAAAITENNLGFDSLMRLPLANYDEAMKDPGSGRGRTILVSGRVIQIRKDGDFFTGQICSGSFCDKVVFFVTPGTTRGIFEDKRATFAGTLVQRYTYPTARGGQAHSLLLVGQFKGQ